MARKALWLLAILVILCGNLLLPQQHERQFRLQQSGPRTRADVLLDVLGEARTVVARMLWFKMDLLHEQLDRQGIPHEKQSDLLPLLRMITLLDHRIEEAYDLIVADLTRGHGRHQEAREILEEGLAYNPRSPILLQTKALLLFQNKRYEEVVPVVQAGLAATTDRVDTLNFSRLGFRAEQRLGHPDRAEYYLRLMFSVAPGDPVAASLWQELRGAPPPPDVLYPGVR